MKELLREWAPVIAIVVTGSGLLWNQGQSFGKLDAKVEAVHHDVAILRSELQYDVTDLRTRVNSLEASRRVNHPIPASNGILWKEAYADTTKPTEVRRPRPVRRK